MQKAWLCLAFGDDRTYAGNEGYQDQISSCYRFDSFVPNHKQIKVGDIFLIRDKKKALGVAKVDSLDVSAGTKNIQRCPVCNITGIKERSTKSPRFRCNDKHEFDSPKVEITSCNKYEAKFGNSFVEIKKIFLAKDLKLMCLTDSDQLSIQRLDFNKVLALISEVQLVNDGSSSIGVPYTTRVVVASTKNREPFEVDPDAIDRATSTHAGLQNSLAEWLTQEGFEPKLPKPSEPQYDLGWFNKDFYYICEAKSLTYENEEKQLRYGLGQIIWYKHNLLKNKLKIKSVFLIERKPSDEAWVAICQSLDILILWPGEFQKILNE